MNTDTGKLHDILTEEDRLNFIELIEKGKMVEVDPKDMTEKQRLEMQVSKHDVNSKLGKVFTGTRKERREKERKYKKGLK